MVASDAPNYLEAVSEKLCSQGSLEEQARDQVLSIVGSTCLGKFCWEVRLGRIHILQFMFKCKILKPSFMQNDHEG